MERIYVFLIRNDVWIYILCALGLLWFISEFVQAQSALSRAMFRLERETALRTRNSALFFIVILVSIAGAVAYVNLQIRPTLPETLLKPPTPTPDPLVVPIGTPTTETTEAAPSPTSPIAPTVTLSDGEPLLTGTITATLTITTTVESPNGEESDTQSTVAGCTPDAMISEPRSAATVRGSLNVYGSANTPDFGSYELEIRGPQTNDRYAPILRRAISQPMEDGVLGGNINLSEWSSGPYQVRLTVSNQEGEVTNRCVVEFRLDNS